ncbi:DMT family transporter [Galbibacter sp. EGI 63066]|uniref:DMT family transporter n=1 Tax=Galbibacter sp. EGI 63066 TaxID=2993559 RepID=UPI00224990F5|nr:DMT family transporter [Galbibacter sp. EGI 63066]MCX2680088.1 DMT family transporter [Galbibacter sp. EGI 63066]
MRNNQYFKHILEINLAVLFISTSGVLGRYITLPPEQTIMFRAMLAMVFVFLFCRYKKYNLGIEKGKDLKIVILCGVFFGIHWVTYFYALQLSSVAIGMLSIYTYPAITSFLEPLILKTRFRKSHVGLAVLVLAGVYFLVPEVSFKNQHFIAVLFGVTSAFFYALRNILMKPKVEKYNGSVLMLYQLVIISILLSPLLFKTNFVDVKPQLWAICFLALLTTTVGHTLLLMSFRHFSATTASIMSSVQPIYGILMGMLFLGEFPAWHTIIGGALILSAVFIESIRTVKDNKNSDEKTKV